MHALNSARQKACVCAAHSIWQRNSANPKAKSANEHIILARAQSFKGLNENIEQGRC